MADTSRDERRSIKMSDLDVRKAAEASLYIKDVIEKTSCFSKTRVMSITPPIISHHPS